MVNKKIIGILFCGGCNCYFDREKFYKKLRKDLETDCEFVYYELNRNPDNQDNQDYDLIVMVNGCQSECLIGLDYKANTLLINNKNYESAAEMITEALTDR